MAFGFCPKCGTQRVGQSRYCGACRFDFDPTTGASPVVAPPPGVDARPPVTPTAGEAARWVGPAPAHAKQRGSLVIGLIALVAIVVVVCLVQIGSSVRPAASGAGNQAPTAMPTATPPPWHKDGEPVIVTSGPGDSIVIAGLATKFGATCGLATAAAGNMFVVIGVMYKAGTEGLFYSSGEWTVHDETNTQFQESFSGSICLADSATLLRTGNLNPGLQVFGAVPFELPADAKHLYADWRATMSGQMETWQLW